MTAHSLSGSLLEQLDAEIARLTAVRAAVVAALAGGAVVPAAAPAKSLVPAEPHRNGHAPKPPAGDVPHNRRARQEALARHLLTVGSLTFTEIGKFFGVSGDTTARLLKSSWFAKQAGAASGSPAPWTLTAAGRAVVTRSAPPPGEPRFNPDLDAAFGDAGGDLFLPESSGPKPMPRPFGTNGTGTAHATAVPVLGATAVRMLRLLAEKPRGMTELSNILGMNQSSVAKARDRLRRNGLAVKPSDDPLAKVPWELTDRGREVLAVLNRDRPAGG